LTSLSATLKISFAYGILLVYASSKKKHKFACYGYSNELVSQLYIIIEFLVSSANEELTYMKKHLRFILTFILPLVLSKTLVYAQSTFATEDELKKQAAVLFENEQFEEAYPLYSQLVSLYQKDVNYNYRLGVCMLYASDDKEKPIAFLEFASNKPEVEKEVLFYLARAYHLNYRFDDAIKKYNEYKKVASAAKAEKLMVERQIEMCKNGKKLLRNITDLLVLDKKEMSKADFYRAYDISEIGGKLLVKPDEPAFKSSIDKKKKENSIIYLSTNNNQLFFASYGDDPERGKDIYTIKKLPNGEWSKPQTLGYPVNTEYDEDFPFLHPNGKVLYFCSKGHNSMGGYDIFKTTLNEETNTWNKPVNMDFPINTPDDDILYVTNENEQEAFFSSARNSVTGKTAVFHINVERRPIEVAIIKGAVVANRDGQALDVRITVKDLGDNSMLGIYNAKENGGYIINLPNGGRFLYTVEATGFKTQSEVVVLPVQYEFKPLKQEISYELGTDKLIIKNLFDEPVDDASYLLAMKYIKDKSKMDVSSANEIAAANNKTTTNETTTNKNTENTTTNENKNQPVNISNSDIVKIAYNDAKEVETEAKELKEQANIALNIANQKSLLAQNKQTEANQLLADANKMQDPNKKKQALQEANDVATEAEQLNQETVAAFNLAKRLDNTASSKQKEADLSLKYAETLEKAVKSKNATAELNKADELQKQLDALNQENANQGNIVNSLKIDVNNKKAELDKAIQTSDDIRQGIADNEKLMKNLQADIEKTKNEKIKTDLQNQIEGLKDDNEENKKDLAFNEQRVVKLQKEYETVKNEMELVSNVVNQSKTTSNESAAASVANIDKNRLEEQVNTIKNSNNTSAAAANNNQKETTGANNPKNSNENSVSAITNNNETNANNNQTASVKENKVDYSYNYTNELENINNTENEIEREKKKVDVYNNWISAINTDIKEKKEEQKTTKDSKRKKELNTEIASLEKELKEKQKDANEAVASFKKMEQQAIASNNNAKENNTANTGTTNETTNNEPPANINKKYAEELYTAQSINNEADREQAKADVLKKWASAIDADIAKKKQEMASSSDPEMKALLAQKIIDLKKQSEEKQTQANEAEARAEELKEKQGVAINNATQNQLEVNENKTVNENGSNEPFSNKENIANTNSNQKESNTTLNTKENNNAIVANNNNTENKTSNTSNKTIENINNTEKTESPIDNSALTYTEQYNKAIEAADKKSNELEKEKTKQEAYTNYISAANNELNVKQQELKSAKDKKRKKELAAEIATLENDINTKQTELATIETNIETLQENAIAKENDSDNTSQTNEKKYTYSSPTAVNNLNKAAEESKQSEVLFTQAKELENKAANTNSTSEKNRLTSESQEVKSQAEKKRIESLLLTSEANTIEIEQNKNISTQYAAASKNKNADELSMAEMMKDEAITYSDRAKKSRASAEKESSFYAKETLLQDANDNEMIALEKQKKAIDIYKKYNSEFVISNTNNKEAINNQNIAANTTNKNINTTENSTAVGTNNSNKQTNENTNTGNENTANNTIASNNNKQANENKSTTNESNVNNVATNTTTNNTTNTSGNNAANNNTASAINENNATATTNNAKSGILLAPTEKFERTTQKEYTASKPIPVNEKLPEGLVFKVQIGAFRNPIPPETFSGMKPITAETTDNGLTRYTAGLFTKFSTADKVKEEIRDLGYKDAFVVAFLNGKRIPINQALEMSGLPPIATNTTNTSSSNNQNGNNTTQTNAFNNVVNNTSGTTNNSANNANQQTITGTQNVTAVGGLFYTVQIGVFSQQVSSDKLYNIQPLYTEVAPNGYIRYNTGIYNNIARATEAKNIVVNAGIKDAFVVVYFNGKRITPAEAQQLIAEGKATYSNAPNMNVLPTVGGRTINATTISTNTNNTNTNTNTNNTTTNNNNNNNSRTTNNTTNNNATTPANTNTNTSNSNNSTNTIGSTMPAEDGVVFRVQIGAFKDEVPLEIANKFLKIAKKGIKNYKNEDGLNIYSVGSYKNYEDASASRAEVVAEGITDAFIVAYYNGKKVSIDEAKELMNK